MSSVCNKNWFLFTQAVGPLFAPDEQQKTTILVAWNCLSFTSVCEHSVMLLWCMYYAEILSLIASLYIAARHPNCNSLIHTDDSLSKALHRTIRRNHVSESRDIIITQLNERPGCASSSSGTSLLWKSFTTPSKAYTDEKCTNFSFQFVQLSSDVLGVVWVCVRAPCLCTNHRARDENSTEKKKKEHNHEI